MDRRKPSLAPPAILVLTSLFVLYLFFTTYDYFSSVPERQVFRIDIIQPDGNVFETHRVEAHSPHAFTRWGGQLVIGDIADRRSDLHIVVPNTWHYKIRIEENE